MCFRPHSPLICLLLLTLAVPCLPQQKAPLSTEFKEYQQRGHSPENNFWYFQGYVPSPTKFPTQGENKKSGEGLPPAYDLRQHGYITPVKLQGNSNNAWAFAAIGAMESTLLKSGLGYYDLSENNLCNLHGFLLKPGEGGNNAMASAYFTGGPGIFTESQDPYGRSGHPSPDSILPIGYANAARYLPDIYSIQDRNVLIERTKESIIDYGALSVALHFDREYYDQATQCYYYDGQENADHMVLLIGWDDQKEIEGETGAWLVKSSWGQSFGQMGYFYVSYRDSKFLSEVAAWPVFEKYDRDEDMYMYDQLGMISAIGWPSKTCTGYGLVKFTARDQKQITRLGSYVSSANSSISFEVFASFNEGTLEDRLGELTVKKCPLPGYYSFDLPAAIKLSEGQDFYIKVKYQTQSYGYPVPVECHIEGYSAPKIESGKCWTSPTGSNQSWTDLGQSGSDLCIRAYLDPIGRPAKEFPKTPGEYGLNQNYPNPFNTTTRLSFSIPEEQMVHLKIYDILGQCVSTLVEERKGPGTYQINFDGSDLMTGVYFYKLQTENFVDVKKMILMK